MYSLFKITINYHHGKNLLKYLKILLDIDLKIIVWTIKIVRTLKRWW